MIEFILQDFGL